MKLVLILSAVGEAEPELVDANIAFHLNAGVDLLIVEDHDLAPEVRRVLEAYAGRGHVQLVRQDAADLSARDVGADWVIRSDPTEFWWPRGGSLKEVLASVPERYGDVRALVRHFAAPDDGSFFAERVLERGAKTESVKSIYRVAEAEPVPLRGWYPIEVFRFQRSEAAEGDRVVDTRLRDALRELRVSDGTPAFALPEAGRSRFSFPRPTVVDDAAYAVEVAALGESDLTRVQKRLEELEARLSALERGDTATPRLWRQMIRAARRLRHR